MDIKRLQELSGMPITESKTAELDMDLSPMAEKLADYIWHEHMGAKDQEGTDKAILSMFISLTKEKLDKKRKSVPPK